MLAFLPIISCNKSIEKNHWKPSISENKMNSLQELFSQGESERLIDIVSTHDVFMMDKYNKLKAEQIVSYFKDKYKIDIREKFIDNPEGPV